MGSIIGGGIGFVLGGPAGAALGIGLGNMAGEFIGGMLDEPEILGAIETVRTGLKSEKAALLTEITGEMSSYNVLASSDGPRRTPRLRIFITLILLPIVKVNTSLGFTK